MRTIALAGNPNCGKTTLFNRLTGQSQHVGNWAGVTVERREGIIKAAGERAALVDLPGIYSLAAYTLEERVAREFLLDGQADAVVNILDGTSLERGLYLTQQLCELGRPMVVAVGMMDGVRAAGGEVRADRMEALLGVPVVPVAARAGENVEALAVAAMERACVPAPPRYGEPLDGAIGETARAIERAVREPGRLRFYAVGLLEDPEAFKDRLRLTAWQKWEVRRIRAALEKDAGEDAASLVAGARYRLIGKILREAVRIPSYPVGGTLTEKIDGVVLHRWLAFPVFLAAMSGMFALCFGGPGLALKAWMERLLAGLSAGLSGWLPALGFSPSAAGLLVDGVLGGVGSVLTFLPQVAMIFLCLTLLEECGYLSRAAFLMDLPLRCLGLTGKSFIPMLMGFGCTTPAVMAARTLGSERDRRLTILLTPYLPCSARFPIYALFAGVFFPRRQGLAVAVLYLVGIVVTAAVGWFLRKGPFRGREAPFLMEFPPYRAPSLRNVLRNAGEKCADFLRKAGTLIFAMSVLIWLLQHVDGGLRFTADPAASLFARAGGALAPLFAPLGFGFREAAVALLAGLVSKEAVVSTLGVSLAGEGPLSAALAARFSPLSSASFLVFCALYTPCVSALATMRRELHSAWRALAAAVMQTAVAYAAALAVFQLGTLWQNLFG